MWRVFRSSVPSTVHRQTRWYSSQKDFDYELFSKYMASGELYKADRLLADHSHKQNVTLTSSDNLVPIPLYNTLIQAWIQKDNLTRAMQLFDIIVDTDREPNKSTLALLFSGTLKKKEYKYTTKILKFMHAKEILLQDIHTIKNTNHILTNNNNNGLNGYSINTNKIENKTVHSNSSINETNRTKRNKSMLKLPPSFPRFVSPLTQQIINEASQVGERVMEYKKLLHKMKTDIEFTKSISPTKQQILLWFEQLSETYTNYLKNDVIEDVFIEKEQKPIIRKSLSLIDGSHLALIALYEVLAQVTIDEEGAKFTQIITSISDKIQNEILQTVFLQGENIVDNTNIDTNSTENSLQAIVNDPNIVNNINNNNINHSTCKNDDVPLPGRWNISHSILTGGYLLSILVTTLTIGKTSAFQHFYKDMEGKSFGMVKASPILTQSISPYEVTQEIINTRSLPMSIPPAHWTSVVRGGYYFISHSVVRGATSSQLKLLEYSPMTTVFQTLDMLGALAWKINPFMLALLQQARSSNFDIRSVGKPVIVDELSASQKRKQQKASYSFQCDLYSKLQTAEFLLSQPRFYFPHSMDFRGRCYPMSAFNHQNSDLNRCLLLFAKGKPLGSHGLFWLKVHIANLFGRNKCSFDDRVLFVEDNLENIIKAVANPLTNVEWWTTADHPWQCLAACFELCEALKLPDPTTFVSHLSVHVDGSCNGLQHYAALGRDIEGATSVNLLPSATPQDVYTAVLNRVKQLIEVDILNNHPHASHINHKLSRKLIKPTVMTYVYGVTFAGARKQLRSLLESMNVISADLLHPVSDYLATQIFKAIESMFVNAREIMTWLTECARIVCRSNHLLSWRTPLGFSVEQPYRRPGKFQVNTFLQRVTFSLEDSPDLPVFVQKQKTAFPPNFIHSLDSTHMLLTARLAYSKSIAFAAVHDSFWTHATDVNELNTLLRESFVNLHSGPLLEELLAQLQSKHPTLVFPPIPNRGLLDIQAVKSSLYFFH